MLFWVYEAAKAVVDDVCIVVGYGADKVMAEMGPHCMYALQKQQLGTGHAVQQALAAFEELPRYIVVLCGDAPLLSSKTVKDLCDKTISDNAACTVLTAVLDDGGSYGRIVRDKDGFVNAIVEAKDATVEQLAIREINSGVYCFDSQWLNKVIYSLTPNNEQGEYYLTDVLEAIRKLGGKINSVICHDADEILGVNDQTQLACVDEILRNRNVAL